jgi:thiamine biosynthesis lipoprotein
MRRVEQIMGLPVSLDVPAATSAVDLEPAFAEMRLADARFSPFRPNSELSRYNRGEIADTDLSADFASVQAACQQWQQATGGYFSAYYGSAFDPSGYVKGWAIGRASAALDQAGWHDYLINAGGDILAASQSDQTWTVGLQHPLMKRKLMGSLNLHNGAVATSGTYARGQHIVNPLTGKAAVQFVSVTVVGPRVEIADVYATAVLAGGRQAWQRDWGEYAVLAIEQDGSAHTNAAWQAL